MISDDTFLKVEREKKLRTENENYQNDKTHVITMIVVQPYQLKLLVNSTLHQTHDHQFFYLSDLRTNTHEALTKP